jgi:hypothetical protein
MLKKMGLVAGNRWIGLAVIRLTEEWFGGIKIAEASLNLRSMGLHREGSLSTLPVAAAFPHTFSSLTLSQLFFRITSFSFTRPQKSHEGSDPLEDHDLRGL